MELREGLPYSSEYHDVFFSSGGVEEVRAVFTEGNELERRFSECRDSFSILELGFGSGLNFLVTLELWERCAPPGARLFYRSIENSPLSAEDLRLALRIGGVEDSRIKEFLKKYPKLNQLWHRLYFGSVSLDLCFEEVEPALKKTSGPIDAFFLDGFAPARNPEMWSESVIREIGKLSSHGSTFATFSSAGEVRRRLMRAGFEVEKRPGFRKKREMASGIFKSSNDSQTRMPPWFASPRRCVDRQVIVLGGGLAGAAATEALLRRGWSVTAVDRNPEPCQETSSHPALLWMPAIAKVQDAISRLSLMGTEYVKRHLTRMKIPFQSGVNQAHRERVRQAALHLGLPISFVSERESGLFYPEAGAVDPRLLCRANLEGAEWVGGFEMGQIERRDGLWVLRSQDGRTLEASNLVLSHHLGIREFFPELSVLRGQRISFSSGDLDLDHPFSDRVSIIPVGEGRFIAGSSHVRGTESREPSRRETVEILSHLPFQVSEVQAWVGVRLTAPDTLPLVGAVPDRESYFDNYRELHHGRRGEQFENAKYRDGLFVLGALGTKGLIYSLLGAELLASRMASEPSPFPPELEGALHPGRFLIRMLKKRPEDR